MLSLMGRYGLKLLNESQLSCFMQGHERVLLDLMCESNDSLMISDNEVISGVLRVKQVM